MKKQYFENEKEARKFLKNLMDSQQGMPALNFCRAIENFRQKGFIKQTKLEEAKKKYINAKNFVKSKCSAEEPYPTTVFINELEKETERLKNEIQNYTKPTDTKD